ncbi:MAG: 3-phosphoglycerate dehydrogenase family protein [Firmicutes bacterium]|nr:3-phosphoglycerate dehydrogenase family protein [Bacillota bacterium]
MEILRLNEISPAVNEVFKAPYKMVKESKSPAAIILRSYNMHDYKISESVLCVGRAGAGVNNIPIDAYAEKGVVVFNTPGANANAVKELVILSFLLCGRSVTDGINWAQSLKGKGAEVEGLVEKGKNQFVGGEILGKKLGVIGLGAIGILTANAAVELGMQVMGYDPFLSVKGAWNLNNHVKQCDCLKTIFAECDFISLHAPLNAQTRNMINAETLASMKDGVNIVNCSRAELCDNAAMIEAVNSGKVNRYVTDFPGDALLGIKNIIPIPHLGASTPEAEDNCAFMVAQQIKDFIENGNVVNSVNFPACSLPRDGKQRVTIIHLNVKNVISSITDIIGKEGVNIHGFVSQSDGKKYAYAILDLDEKLNEKVIEKIKKLDNVIKVRVV